MKVGFKDLISSQRKEEPIRYFHPLTNRSDPLISIIERGNGTLLLNRGPVSFHRISSPAFGKLESCGINFKEPVLSWPISYRKAPNLLILMIVVMFLNYPIGQWRLEMKKSSPLNTKSITELSKYFSSCFVLLCLLCLSSTFLLLIECLRLAKVEFIFRIL